MQNIFKSNNCETDYLEVRDGYYFKSPLIGRFCGKVSNEMITTQSSRMLLTYVNTHRSEGYRGFKAEFEGKPLKRREMHTQGIQMTLIISLSLSPFCS